MEYLILILASALAGIGTGLVGLSAATAMVPILVVLCPTFQGEHGAFMATAIALASDILGSAVTTGVYAKNKKIDLKHGWIMLACILAMCTLGSVAAYFTHQMVLGSFTLFLCVAIGIRFLVKPDSKPRDGTGNVKLTPFQIGVSLFFGLTIGFGTGFFGSGGGMMMLIVFTAFLHYERKTAVGTSTFIMTFTALIATVAHIFMEPSILLERWDYLLIAIGVSTLFSLVSAQFANKVNTKIVGYVTGALLFVLGIVLVLFNYREYIPWDIMLDALILLGEFFGILAVCVVILLTARKLFRIPQFVWRKLLHIIAYCSILIFTLLTDNYLVGLIADGYFLVLIFLGLILIEGAPFYKDLFVEKFPHEVLISFLILFGMMAASIAFNWGFLQAKYICIVAIMAWGPGDAMAALIGIPFGKHKLKGKLIEGTKSVEGFLAMMVTSFVCTLFFLFIFGPYAWYWNIGISLVVAVAAAFTELFTKWGLDTVTVPIVSSLILFLFSLL